MHYTASHGCSCWTDWSACWWHTTGMMPRALLNRSGQPLPGVAHIHLQGLDPADAERMMREAGVQGDSARMQQYVQRHFAGHPLVVGVVAGLVARYRRRAISIIGPRTL